LVEDSVRVVYCNYFQFKAESIFSEGLGPQQHEAVALPAVAQQVAVVGVFYIPLFPGRFLKERLFRRSMFSDGGIDLSQMSSVEAVEQC
jgi:hypothetical protein